MKPLKAKRSLRSLSDEEIESCINGCTDIDMLKNIFSMPHVIKVNGYISTDLFADYFATYLEGFLDGEEGSTEWREANNINYEWGLDIATNINELLSGEKQTDFY